MLELNKKEIKAQLEEITKFVESDVQDDWYIYSTLRDKLKQLEIVLEQNGVIQMSHLNK